RQSQNHSRGRIAGGPIGPDGHAEKWFLERRHHQADGIAAHPISNLTDQAVTKQASVFALTSSRVTFGASSRSLRVLALRSTEKTQRSVMMRSMQPVPVSGRVQALRILDLPALLACSISAITRLTPATRSIAPPMPFTILPGMVQLAISPPSETSIAPRMAMSI